MSPHHAAPAAAQAPSSSPGGSSAPPLISVITPSYNQGAFIAGCLASVRAQDGVPCEHIVIDNCSTDGTLDVLARHDRVRWRSEPDRGQSHALNKALALARGEIIAWINADDAYLPGAFEAVAAALGGAPGLLAVAGGVEHVSAAGRVLSVFRPSAYDVGRMSEFWRGYGLEQPGVFFRRAALERIGLLDETLHYAMDYEFFLRLRSAGEIRVLDRVLARFVEHAKSKTGRQRLGDAFVQELEQVAKRYWGPRGQPAYARRRGACRRHLADHYASAVWRTQRVDGRIDWAALRRMLANRPTLALHPRLWRALVETALARGQRKTRRPSS